MSSWKIYDQLVSIHEDLGNTIKQIESMLPPKNETIVNVKEGENLQAALDQVGVTGGVINVGEGVFPAPILSTKGKLVLIKSTEGAQLLGFYAPINTGNVSFDRIKFINPDGRNNHVMLGADKNGMKKREEVPVGFTFLECEFTGPGRRAIMANCADLMIDSCKFFDYRQEGFDSQAIAGWNGSKNHIIRNSFLEAASENIMYGGSDCASEEMIPQDIHLEGCFLNKKEEWKTAKYNMKCSLELKNVLRMTIRKNKIYGNWRQAWGDAPAIVIKSVNQEGGNPYARSEDVVIDSNIIENVGTYLTILGEDDSGNLPARTKNIMVRNNLFHQMNNEPDGRALKVGEGPINVIIDHNSFYHNRHSFIETWGKVPEGLVYTNNIAFHGSYGIFPATYRPVQIECNAIKIHPDRKVKLPESNIYYSEINESNLAGHVTTDGHKVGASL